jgi:uncharacterized membrane protein
MSTANTRHQAITEPGTIEVTTVLVTLGAELAQWLPGLAQGGIGGLAYALAEFLIDSKDGFPEQQLRGLYAARVIVRVILGAVIGAATLALGNSAAFVSGLAGPAALIGLGANFGRRKSPPGGKAAVIGATDGPNVKRQA